MVDQDGIVEAPSRSHGDHYRWYRRIVKTPVRRADLRSGPLSVSSGGWPDEPNGRGGPGAAIVLAPRDDLPDLTENGSPERVIRAAIRKRQEAAQIYQAARHEGRVAAVLEPERPNIFTQHVTNIMPGHDVVVRIRYFEELQWNSGYELVVPTVVGPRYIPRTPTVSSTLPASAPAPESRGGQDHGPAPDAGDRGGTGWSPDTDLVPDASRITPHVLPPGADSGHDIDIVVDLDAGVPLETIESVNHAVDVVRDGESRARVKLRPVTHISRIVIFTVKPPQPISLYFDALRLE